MTARWPLPGDRAVDRARQVAHEYRKALLNTDPAACAVIDDAAVKVGEEWVLPQVDQYYDDDRITVAEAALLTGRSVRWVYAWVAEKRAERAHVGPDKLIRVKVAAVRDAADRVAC
ncbi:hypothetical protein [Pseudonocardia parietis]|uniref:Helix-turn-helix domain-containing protein n=1 Tax=Pseudonocardia parietis TaxID=570936 RepID=A0ABS4W3H3_9PSEU|nr:hypothetical protein [Pseudonocardia parietis]MBP2370239.1 hypothetical protein [Pseudonocardia parietis]